MKPCAAPFITGPHWAPLPGSMSLAEVDALLAAAAVVRAHGMSSVALDEFVAANQPKQRCRVCGCGEFNACVDEEQGACWWVEDDLCSACGPEAA